MIVKKFILQLTQLNFHSQVEILINFAHFKKYTTKEKLKFPPF